MATPKKSKTKSQPPATVQNFPVVGIGASAGGLDAFISLIKAIPENSGMAYVLVQHLAPSHESILPEILQRGTKIPVIEITDDIQLAPDHIYVIPPNKLLISTDGVLKLTERSRKINLSIDIFFTSLAEVHKEFAVGIVLSGTGTDGTLGLKAIKENGGISIAQDSESAGYDGMPLSAINAGVVDFVLAPEKIPEQLLHINSTFRNTHVFNVEEEELPKDDETIFKQIISLIRQRSGVDFTYYKQPTIRRRIARRIAITKKANLTSYLKFFKTEKAEQDALFQDILIPVTSFFRDPKTFEFLSTNILPVMFKNKAKEEPLRIWIAGCSTGEEAYSIAIIIREYMTLTKRDGLKVQLFASDISEKAILTARAGIYAKADVEKLSMERINKYFTKRNHGYEVNKLIRDMCVFTPHNFLKDPPFAKMDLISCRNVLIYMDSFLQKKALTTFHYALKENGFLVLGKSESTSNVSELFSAADTHEKIYLRKQLPGRFIHIATEPNYRASRRKEEVNQIKSELVTNPKATETDFRKSAEAMLLSNFTPASVVVNEQMDIVHIHGTVTPFLEPPQGKPTFNLLKMANEALAFELRNALHKAKQKEVAVLKENIPIKVNEKQYLVNIEIVPLTDTVDIHYLILFTKTAVPASGEKSKTPSSRKMDDVRQKYDQLEKELAHTREDMRSVTEDMEATNEELQSANEELQSSNEEMQSLNEEMETSKEELQSTNEELIIINQELMDKQEQLNAARLYSDSIVSTIRHPLIVLDKSHRIKTANDAFYKTFETNEEKTENKLFYEIQNNRWDDVQMRALLENILPKREIIVDLELSIKFSKLSLRHFLINARQIKNEKTEEYLVLLVIEDITKKITSEQKLEKIRIELEEKINLIQESEKEQKKNAWQFKLATDSAKVGIWSINLITSKIDWSNIHKLMWGYDKNKDELTYDDWYKAILPEDRKMALQKVEEAEVNRSIYDIDYRIARVNDGAIVWIKSTGQYHYDEFGVAHTFTGISIDISEQKLFDEELLEAKTKAETATQIAEHAVLAKQQFLSNMSHEIRTPLNAIIGFAKVLTKTDLTEKQKEYLQAIKSSGNTLIVLVNDILDLAKVDAGKMVFANEPFKISNSITTILQLFEQKIQESNLELVKEYDPRIPETVLGDATRLHQILINLMSNAIKFTAKGKITVCVNLLNEDEEKVTIEVKITDTGIGIPQNKIASIFNAFEQAYVDTSTVYGGTGLGLAIVKQLVEKQGGTISLESKVGEGSTFNFTLSFQKSNAAVEVEKEEVQFKAEFRALKVLIVEDVKLNQLLMRTILDEFKFEWDMADNGKIAIEKLQTNDYDIILMDLQMPIMNGFEATEYIRNTLKSKIPIIALTADVTTVDLEKCKTAGMNDYISKPLNENLLHSKILELVKL